MHRKIILAAQHFRSLLSLTITNVQKQKEELKRIHNMLDDLENDFMGSKENNTFIERYMEVRTDIT